MELWPHLTDLYVFGSIISQPLVHLVADAQHIMFDAQISDHLELFSLVNLSGGKDVCLCEKKHILFSKTTKNT